jgi:hypothetical protein
MLFLKKLDYFGIVKTGLANLFGSYYARDIYLMHFRSAAKVQFGKFLIQVEEKQCQLTI